MRKILVIVTLFIGALSAKAQEKVMNVTKTDGTNAQTRLADLKQISFLTLDEGSQGLLIKTQGGETTAVLFEANPVVTISKSKLVIKSKSAANMEFEINDIAEIQFGDTSDATAIREAKGFAFVMQEGGALLRGIPADVKPRICTIDGRSIPTPPFRDGELRLSRETLGTGIFIVKVGTFSAKVKL